MDALWLEQGAFQHGADAPSSRSNDCREKFPHFAAPELLNEEQFYKFCYYSDESYLTDFPKNYLPHAYRDAPDKWEQSCREQEERIQAFEKTEFGRARRIFWFYE